MLSFGTRFLLLLAAACCLLVRAFADQKIVTRQTINGAHAVLQTVYIRGERQRLESRAEGLPPGGQADNNILIEQFDRKRVLELSPRYKTYSSAPMDVVPQPRPVQQPAATRGGDVNVTLDSIDTGERKMIGSFTARHVRSTTTVQAGPGACQHSRITRVDGWYIDLHTVHPAEHKGGIGFVIATQPGCRDRFHVRKMGTAPQGYPVEQTYSETEQSQTISTSTELLEVSTAALDPRLFELPRGYRPALPNAGGYDFSRADTFSNRVRYYWDSVVYTLRRWF